MATQHPEISDKFKQFISQQKIFFVATAASDGTVNLSPKGMDSFRVLDANRVIWLNMTGSGNETSAHVQQNPRMTIMFTAFEGKPLILRLYGKARVVHQNDTDWNDLFSHFDPIPGFRQIFDCQVDLVQTSCGMSVPFYDYVEEREQLTNHSIKKGEQGIKDYWREKNQFSIDGQPTHIVDKNLKPEKAK